MDTELRVDTLTQTFSFPDLNASFFFLNSFLMFYLFLMESEKETMSGGGAEREGDTESEALGCQDEPDLGPELTSCEITT